MWKCEAMLGERHDRGNITRWQAGEAGSERLHDEMVNYGTSNAPPEPFIRSKEEDGKQDKGEDKCKNIFLVMLILTTKALVFISIIPGTCFLLKVTLFLLNTK